MKKRIDDIECGRQVYDSNLYTDLVDLSGISLSDRVREDVGLGS
jgi:hypothetical protein